MDKERIERAVRELLLAIGEDPDRSGLKETPKRVANMCEELLSGMIQNPMLFSKMFEEEDTHKMIIVRNIQFYSLCEHHMLPFYGTVSIGYIPYNGKVIGLSKLARIVDCFARRLQLQEKMTAEIARCIKDITDATGVCVIVKAEHMCMSMRGIKSIGSQTITSVYLGQFQNNNKLKKEFLDQLAL